MWIQILQTRANRSTWLWIAGLCLVAAAGCGDHRSPYIDANLDNAKLIGNEFKAEGGGAAAGPKSNPLEVPGRTPSWATLTGVVKVSGSPPSPRELSITKDPGVCKPDGVPVFSNALEIGPDNGVKDVLVYLFTDLPRDDSDEETPVWVHPDYSLAKHPDLAEKLFDQRHCVFLSHGFTVRTQQLMKIANSDPIGHNTNISNTAFNRSIPVHGFELWNPEGEMRSPTPVSCSVHPWMSAWLIARDNPYAQTTAASGEFTIENVPADVPIPLEFRIWHEKTDFLNPASIESITIDGEPVEVKRGGKLMWSPVGGKTYKLELVINASAFQ